MSEDETKTCFRCQVEKPVTDFAWKRRDRGQRASYCRTCQKVLMQAHYQANREIYIERARKRTKQVRLERTRLLLDHFEKHPCVDCGETDPLVLEFDHLADKRFNVSEMVAQRAWSEVLAEIAKCEVVCANCHRRRTAHRRPTVRLILSEAGGGNRTRLR